MGYASSVLKRKKIKEKKIKVKAIPPLPDYEY
jgi:hypothetical protein